jgi:hypothetical protein
MAKTRPDLAFLVNRHWRKIMLTRQHKGQFAVCDKGKLFPVFSVHGIQMFQITCFTPYSIRKVSHLDGFHINDTAIAFR